ncbi:hypothetical protein ACPT8I_07995 [Lactiplantibacillus plantarum]|uniref:hypothetical protein n=1 Tax=Lactiplantibacillus plantarum TaxID=1590 RepID=UPI0024BA78F7|nr:hypothetical protein [Lactiplantibacillus plantarum]WHQ55068.1 hypothetical protein M1857_04070 [Lactiplantibacillus plantarum]BEI48162.1 membrane protein [Lactiplantibacillus plantarum]
MDFSDWFDFNNRVKQDITLVKEVNGRTVTKQVKGSFNWLAFIFTFFYALFSQKYKTKDFLKKTAVPFVTLILINFIAELILGRELVLIINFAGNIWYGFMFDTWFKNQLVVNGYHVDNSAQSESDTGQHDFE